ncbi:DUF4291 family protein [Acinetobacter bereziniae]|uniref:DUF4291 family protein n=1 Tax=Acinetobacter bereziniae TaxID=106648 RepID=UPI00321597D5
MDYREIQISLKGEAVQHYIRDGIVNILNIPQEAQHIDQLVLDSQLVKATTLLPKETLYLPNISKVKDEL